MPQSVPPFTTDLNAALRRVASLMEPNPELAEQQAREILKSYPAEVNALTFLGAALRAHLFTFGGLKETTKWLQQVAVGGKDNGDVVEI